MTTAHRLLAAALLAGALSPHARAGDEAPLALIVPADAEAFEGTGRATDLAGDLLAVGRLGHTPDGGEVGSGAVDLMRFDGSAWQLEQQLSAPDGQSSDYFGSAVALSPDGRRVVVGAYRHAVSGAAYVFRKEPGGWVFEQKLTPPTAIWDDHYGETVDMTNDLVLVGAPWREVGVHPNGGSVFAYRLSGGSWSLEADLDPGSLSDHGLYGTSLAVDDDGDTVVVGAPQATIFGINVGLVYVMQHDGGGSWSLAKTIKVNQLTSGVSPRFGASVAIDGERMVAGAPGDTNSGVGTTGSAFVFDEAGGEWALVQELLDTSGANGDAFGTALDLDGDRLVVSATLADVSDVNQGAAVRFVPAGGGSWQPDGRLEDGSLPAITYLGTTVDLDGDLCVMGAGSYSGPAGQSQGAVAVFDLLEPQWTWLGQGLAGAAGTPVLSPEGELAAGQPVVIELEQAAPSAAVVLVLGASSLGLPLKGGVLVPSPDVFVDGLASDGQGGLVLPATWPGGIPAGLEVFLQAWVVDGSGPVGFSASHGLRGLTS